jgi:O-antigen ligase
VALYGLVVLVVVAPWPYGGTDPRVVQGLTVVTLTLALWAAAARTFHARRERAPVPAWPLAGLFGLAVLQVVPMPRGLLTLLAPGPAALYYPETAAAAAVLGPGAHPISLDPDATRRALAFAAGLVALALAAVPALRARRLALASATIVCGGALAVAVYGVVARTLFGNLLFGRIVVPTVAPFGPFVSKNHFAGYVEMAALLAAGLALGLADEARRSKAALSWVGSPRAGRVVLAGGAAVAMALAVLISLSRGGASSLAAGAVALVGLRLHARRRARATFRGWAAGALVIGVGLGALAVLPPEARDRLATLAGMSRDNSGQFRLGVWADTLRLSARSPALGHGFGAYADALPAYKTGLGYVTVEHAESDVLEVLAEGGLLALALTMAALFFVARAAAGGLPAQGDRLRRGLGLGAGAGAAALLVHSAFDFNLRIPSNALLFSFLAALALSASDPSPADRPPGEGQAAPGPQPSRLATLAWATALALALVLALVTPVAPTRALPEAALAFAVKGGRPVTPLRVAQATRAVEGHLRGRPAQAEAWLFLAWLRSAAGDRAQATALARYAASLDPQRSALVEAAARIAGERP